MKMKVFSSFFLSLSKASLKQDSINMKAPKIFIYFAGIWISLMRNIYSGVYKHISSKISAPLDFLFMICFTSLHNKFERKVEFNSFLSTLFAFPINKYMAFIFVLLVSCFMRIKRESDDLNSATLID